ncbi:hypothetical protein D3C77_354060 [compost metagenome]
MLLPFGPDPVDVIDRNVDFAIGMINRVGVDQAEVQTGFTRLVGDLQRVVETRVFRKVFHPVDDRATVPLLHHHAVGAVDRLTMKVFHYLLHAHKISLVIRALNDDVLRSTTFDPWHRESASPLNRLAFEISHSDDVSKRSVLSR